ncbi:MAG TPA: GNAT family protein [Candidatus Eremiobacteraceae bacterium]
MIPKDLILETTRVRLTPLLAAHAEDLHLAGNDPEIFRYTRLAEDLSSVESTLVRRVQIAADSENVRSEMAIRRIGGVYKGAFRNFAFREQDQTNRDHMIFSVIDSEWEEVKARLKDLLR